MEQPLREQLLREVTQENMPQSRAGKKHTGETHKQMLKDLKQCMFKGMNRHEGHLRNQRIDVSRVREFTKIYAPLMRPKSLIRAIKNK